MADLLALLLPLAEGRSQNPDDGVGIAVILGIVVLMVVVVGAAWFLVARAAGRRRGVRDLGA